MPSGRVNGISKSGQQTKSGCEEKKKSEEEAATDFALSCSSC
jgi:hypothetical protein